jgi:hypothetical protein
MIVLCLSSPLRQWKVVGRDKLVDICVSLVVCIMWTRVKAHTYTYIHTLTKMYLLYIVFCVICCTFRFKIFYCKDIYIYMHTYINT